MTKRKYGIIDTHTHIGLSPRLYLPIKDADGLVQRMDSLGIAISFFTHTTLICNYRDKYALRETDEALDKYAGRLYTYVTYDARDSEGSIRYVRSRIGKRGIIGVKIHPSFNEISADDERFRPIWKLADREGRVILSHSWDISVRNPVQKLSHPSLFAKYLKEYKTVNLILGHGGGKLDGCRTAVKICQEFSNVYVDLSGDCYTPGRIEYFTKHIGEDRILFGSDCNWIDQRTQLGMLLSKNFKEKTYEKILFDNARRLFRNVLPKWNI